MEADLFSPHDPPMKAYRTRAELANGPRTKHRPTREPKMKKERDIEKTYSTADFVAKLRRLADALEAGEQFEIQIANERIYVPVRAKCSIEHERSETEEEIEFQIKWEKE